MNDWFRVRKAAQAQQLVIVEHGPMLLFRAAAPPKPASKLNDRETACLQALADGKRPDAELGIEQHAAKHALAKAYRKLGVGDQASAIFAAMYAGMIK